MTAIAAVEMLLASPRRGPEHSGAIRWAPAGAPGSMSRQEAGPGHLWVQEGGRGEPTLLLLLHGLGASGEVWAGVRDLLDRRWPGRWVIPDLRGHGRSGHASPYSLWPVCRRHRHAVQGR
jgi:pimeloyl-ACP methyl ester carboxylesterase